MRLLTTATLLSLLLVPSGAVASEGISSESEKKQPDYADSVARKLNDAFSPALHKEAKVTITFRISPEGKPSWVEITDSSPSPAVNRAAQDCIFYAQPFPKPTNGKKYVDVEAIFESDLPASRVGGYCRPTKEQQRLSSGLFKEAGELIGENNFKEAADKLEEALAASPFNYAIKLRYVDCLLKVANDLAGEKKAHLLHKAVLMLPNDQRAKDKLLEYWKEISVDPGAYQIRYQRAVEYDKQGKPEDALAEFYLVWQEHRNPEFIDDINLATSHYLALPQVKKWQKYYDRSPTPQMMQQLSIALKNAGAYEKAAKLSGDDTPLDIESLREEKLKKLSSTELDAEVPFELARKKKILVSEVQDRKRKVDYLAHAIKAHKGVTRWTPGRFPLKVYTKNGHGIKGYHPSFNNMVIDCFKEWAEASQNRLSFVPVGSEKGANIVVEWASDPSKLAKNTGQEQGVTYFKYMKANKGNYNIIGATITILTMHRRRLSVPVGVKGMRPVILHELGHALGISGHSPYKTDIMFPMLMPWSRNLSNQDKATILRLYQGYEHN